MDNKATKLIKLTNNIYRCTQTYMDKNLEKFNLTVGTYPYLFVLNKNPGISQNEISRELNVDKAMSARTVSKLIKLGYIRKEENVHDIRAYKLYITEQGKSIIPEIFSIVQEWIDILVKGNSEEKIQIAIEFLESVLENAKKHKRKECERKKNVE